MFPLLQRRPEPPHFDQHLERERERERGYDGQPTDLLGGTAQLSLQNASSNISRNASFPITHQHAYPLHRDPSQSSRHFQNSTPKSEHTLRRKTPNGTLAAGYDGTHLDSSVEAHANKHFLIQSQHTDYASGLRPVFAPDAWDRIPSSQRHMALFQGQHRNNASHTYSPYVQGPFDNSLGDYHVENDSVLQQIPLQSIQRYPLPNTSQIPTVLQPNWQIPLGPTTSNGKGPYGPYWPDGAYVPYRPAAYRDTRFDPSVGWSNGNDFKHLQPHLIHQNHSIPQASYDAVHTNNGSDLSAPYDSMTDSRRFFNAEVGAGLNNAYDQHPPLPYHMRPHYNDPGGYGEDSGTREWHSTSDGKRQRLQAASSNGHITPKGTAEFKEKVLSWAHSVYVDLLASIHQMKRNKQSQGLLLQGQHNTKMSIFPKPPRQPGSDFSARRIEDDDDAKTPTRANSLSQESSKRPSNFDRSDSWAYSDRNKDQFGAFKHGSSDPFRTIRRGSAPLFTNGLSGAPLMTNAMSALDMLTNLCQESGWEWIDGMLLGGCLAYGLGDYHKALKWYSKILAKDSR